MILRADLPDPLLALTLRRPWPHAILELGKRCENRSWTPSRTVLGSVIALHAGGAYDDEGYDFIEERAPMPTPDPGAALAVVGLARVVGWLDDRERVTRIVVAPGMEHLSRRVGSLQREDTWWMGPVGWLLDDVVALSRPVPAKGALNLWRVPPVVRELVAEQLAA